MSDRPLRPHQGLLRLFRLGIVAACLYFGGASSVHVFSKLLKTKVCHVDQHLFYYSALELHPVLRARKYTI